MSKILLLVGGGGASGAVLRYMIWRWLGVSQVGFPKATFIVNMVGSLLIGVLFALLTEEKDHTTRLFAITGFLGGFTTFSSFTWESFMLFQEGKWKIALTYIVASNISGLVFVLLGFFIVKALKNG